MSDKPFLMILGPIWSKIVFWNKKLPNVPKNNENLRFFEFPKSKNGWKWSEVADNYSKTLALLQSLSKIFFVSQTQKFMKIFQKKLPPPPKKKAFFGGGGGSPGVRILNVVFAGFGAAEKKTRFFYFRKFTFSLPLISILGNIPPLPFNKIYLFYHII